MPYRQQKRRASRTQRNTPAGGGVSLVNVATPFLPQTKGLSGLASRRIERVQVSSGYKGAVCNLGLGYRKESNVFMGIPQVIYTDGIANVNDGKVVQPISTGSTPDRNPCLQNDAVTRYLGPVHLS